MSSARTAAYLFASMPIPAVSVGAVGGGQTRNTVFNELPILSGAHFICREPLYVGLFRRGGCLLVGSGLAYSALSAPAIPWPLAALLSIASGLAMLAAIRQQAAPILFAGDSPGVYFPSRPRFSLVGRATAQCWLFVPWSNISAIKVQRLLDESGSRRGVAFSLRVSEEERRRYFPESVRQRPGVSSASGAAISIGAAYPGGEAGSPERLAERLRRMQRRASQSAGVSRTAGGHEAVTTSA